MSALSLCRSQPRVCNGVCMRILPPRESKGVGNPASDVDNIFFV